MYPPDATTVGAWLIGAAALITALVVTWRFAVAVLAAGRRLVHFLDDWFGEAPRPGVPGRPGFPDRLGKVETAVKGLREEIGEIREQVAEIVHELHPNAGSSLRDAVNRIEARTIRLPKTSSPSHEGADG
ncbi:MAG: hypothetical protein IRZ07_12480 [Microbispora sp.]|jgi:hypothetical protein|nr:hypothetical protein [Microbispora sp.]